MNQPPRWAPGYVVILSAITSIVLAVSVFFIHGPSTQPDELSYLLNGRVLTGHTETPLPNVRAFYQAGYSMVTAVGALFDASIAVQFHVSLFLNIFCVFLTGIVLYALLTRHFKLSARWAGIVAATICVAPSVAAFSLFAYAESLSRLLISVIVLLIFEISASPSFSKMIATGAVAGFLPIVHGRFVLVLPLTVVAIVVAGCATRARRYSTVVTGVACCVVVYFIFDQINASLRDELYAASVGKEDRIIERMTTLNEWPHILRSATGQMWYLISTSFGLAFVGIAVVVVALWRHVTQRSWRQAIPVAYVISVVGTVALTSSVQLAHISRPDHLIYGRYVEAVSPVLVAIGCAALITATNKKTWWLSIGVMVALMGTLLISTNGDHLREMIVARRYFSPPNAIALDWTRDLFAPIGYVVLTMVFAALGIVMLLLWRQSAIAGLVFLGAIGATTTVYTATQTIIPYREIRDDLVLDNEVERLTPVDERTNTSIAINIDTRAGNAFIDYRYLVHPIQITPIDNNNVVPDDVNCVISTNIEPPTTNGWSVEADEPRLDLTLWMREGLDSC